MFASNGRRSWSLHFGFKCSLLYVQRLASHQSRGVECRVNLSSGLTATPNWQFHSVFTIWNAWNWHGLRRVSAVSALIKVQTQVSFLVSTINRLPTATFLNFRRYNVDTPSNRDDAHVDIRTNQTSHMAQGQVLNVMSAYTHAFSAIRRCVSVYHPAAQNRSPNTQCQWLSTRRIETLESRMQRVKRKYTI